MKGDAHGGCRAGVSFYIVWLATSNKNYAELRAVDAAFVSACALADWRLGVSQMYARQMAAILVVQNESVKKHKKTGIYRDLRSAKNLARVGCASILRLVRKTGSLRPIAVVLGVFFRQVHHY